MLGLWRLCKWSPGATNYYAEVELWLTERNVKQRKTAALSKPPGSTVKPVVEV